MRIPDEFFHGSDAPGPGRPSSPRRASRCFRTTADGRIAVTRDWKRLISGLGSFGPLALQTRHAYARMVMLAPVPAFKWCPYGRGAVDAGGALRLRPEHWHTAWARLAHCDCCGSPGRIEICNRHGLDFFQACALPECEPGRWADFLTGVTDPTIQEAAVDTPLLEGGLMPCLSAEAEIDQADAMMLLPLLHTLAGKSAKITCFLATAEAAHRREFELREVREESGILTGGAGLSRFQIGMMGARRLSLSRDDAGLLLHVIGVSESILMTFSAGSGASDIIGWTDVLGSVFPDASAS